MAFLGLDRRANRWYLREGVPVGVRLFGVVLWELYSEREHRLGKF